MKNRNKIVRDIINGNMSVDEKNKLFKDFPHLKNAVEYEIERTKVSKTKSSESGKQKKK